MLIGRLAGPSLVAMVLLASLAALLHAHPLPMPQTTENAGGPLGSRYRRKVGQLKVGSKPLEYMKQLRSSLSDEDGRPKNYTQSPTSVWCFMDKDITQEQFREKPTNGESCKSVSRYLFRLDAITRNGIPPERLTLTEGRFRPYLQVIRRHVTGGRVVPVQLSIELNVFIDRNVTTMPNKSSSMQLQSVNISSESDGWLELDVTSALSEVWSPTNDHILVEVRLVSTVDCETFTKVPLKFINPAEIPLDQPLRRERHLDLQPLLVVSSDDSLVKETIAKGSEVREVENEKLEMQGIEERRRRSAPSHPCRIENFPVTYSDLRLTDFITPNWTNIKRCAGSCSHAVLRNADSLATNHAKLMASAKIVDEIFPSVTFEVEPQNPCCVPVEYSSTYIIERVREGDDFVFEMTLYPNFVVERCGCR